MAFATFPDIPGIAWKLWFGVSGSRRLYGITATEYET